MNNEKYLFVISGPSGAGKDTVVAKLKQMYPHIKQSVSATTREMRSGEENAVHYYFMSNEDFLEKIENNEMLEHTNYCGNYYGTPKFAVEKAMQEKTIILLVIEVQGAANIKKLYKNSTTIFVYPPSMQELENRLRSRATETQESIDKRLNRASIEVKLADEYDFAVENKDIEVCAKEIYEIIKLKTQE